MPPTPSTQQRQIFHTSSSDVLAFKDCNVNGASPSRELRSPLISSHFSQDGQPPENDSTNATTPSNYSMGVALKRALWSPLHEIASEVDLCIDSTDPSTMDALNVRIQSLFPQLSWKIKSISNAECPINLPTEGETLHSQLSSLDFEGGGDFLAVTEEVNSFIPQPITSPTNTQCNERPSSDALLIRDSGGIKPCKSDIGNSFHISSNLSTPAADPIESTPSMSGGSPLSSGHASRTGQKNDYGKSTELEVANQSELTKPQLEDHANHSDVHANHSVESIAVPNLSTPKKDINNLTEKDLDRRRKPQDVLPPTEEFCPELAEDLMAKQSNNLSLTSSLSKMTFFELIKEKDRTKAVLRSYDRAFEKVYTRLPTRMEKEPMRKLYMHYRRVKLSIEKAIICRNATAANEPHTPTESLATIGGLSEGREDSESVEGIDPAASKSQSWIHRMHAGRRKSVIENEEENADMITQRQSNALPIARSLSETGVEKLPGNLLSQQLSLEEAERKLSKLTAQKNILARRLQAFQEGFEKRYGRRIRYHRDIVDIDDEYRNYKRLRGHVRQLAEIVRNRRVLLTARGDRDSSLSSQSLVGSSKNVMDSE